MIYLHCASDRLDTGIGLVNSDIERVLNRVRMNGLHLNAIKTQAIIVSISGYINTVNTRIINSVIVDGEAVLFVPHVKYLGVTITSTLSWGLHINNVTKKIRAVLYRFKLSRELLMDSLKKTAGGHLDFFIHRLLLYGSNEH